MEKLIKEYGNHLRAVGKAKTTIRKYTDDARFFAKIMEGRSRLITETTVEDIEYWMASMNEQGHNPNSIRSRVVSLSVFFGWLKSKDMIKTIPTHKVELPRFKKFVPDYLESEEEILEFCNNPLSNRGMFRARDIAILHTFCFAGVRSNELICLKKENLNIENREILVKNGKGDKERYVYFESHTEKALSEYLEAVSGNRMGASEWLFPAKKGGKISKSMIDKIVAGVCQNLSLKKNITPHSLRHCISNDTEVLTMNGWKFNEDLLLGEKIYTINLKNKKIELKSTTGIYRYKYRDVLYHLKNRYMDCLITPEHSIPVKICKCGWKNGKKCDRWGNWQLLSIANFVKTKNKRLVRYLLNGDGGGNLSIGKARAAILGWIMTDGHIAKKDSDVTIFQSLSANPEKCKIIENTLKESGIKFYKKPQKFTTSAYTAKPFQMIVFRISQKDTEWIFEWLNKDGAPKWKLLKLKHSELEEMHRSMLLGDGSKNEFCDQDKNKIDIFRVLSLFLGYRSLSGTYYENLKGLEKRTRVRTFISKKNYCQLRDDQIKKVFYDGLVWCPETINKTFIARRNNKIFITGNSFGFLFAERGGDIKTCQKLLGHSGINMTEIYFHPSKNAIQSGYKKVMEKKGGKE